MYTEIPRAARLHEELPLPIQPDDPSEAIRSGEILEQLGIGFNIEAIKGYGGNILSVLYPQVNWEKAPERTLPRLIRADKERAVSEGPYHAVIVARPKGGASKVAARLRYWGEPKWRRMRWEVNRRLGRDVPF